MKKSTLIFIAFVLVCIVGAAGPFIKIEMEAKTAYEEALALSDNEKANKEAVESLVSSYEAMEERRQKSVEIIESQSDKETALVNELRSITDENGNINPGYEQRAAEITNQLSEALGIEINIVNNQVSNSENVPDEYLSALEKAENYSQTMSLSKQRIYQQLISHFDGFSEEAAQYAVNNMSADWKANALAKAEHYSESAHMSKQGIYDQLVSEYGEYFTPDEAQYAIDNIQADWKANALMTAKEYQESMNMSLEEIRNQLISEYGERFTSEEADYAVEYLMQQ